MGKGLEGASARPPPRPVRSPSSRAGNDAWAKGLCLLRGLGGANRAQGLGTGCAPGAAGTAARQGSMPVTEHTCRTRATPSLQRSRPGFSPSLDSLGLLSVGLCPPTPALPQLGSRELGVCLPVSVPPHSFAASVFRSLSRHAHPTAPLSPETSHGRPPFPE